MTDLTDKFGEWWRQNIFRVEDSESTVVSITRVDGWYMPPDVEPLDGAVLSPERRLKILAYAEAVLIPDYFENGTTRFLRVGCKRRETHLLWMHTDEIIHNEPYKEDETKQQYS